MANGLSEDRIAAQLDIAPVGDLGHFHCPHIHAFVALHSRARILLCLHVALLSTRLCAVNSF